MTFAHKPYKRERSYPSAIPESQRRNAVFARMDELAALNVTIERLSK